MVNTETFGFYQPLGNSDPAHTASAPGGLTGLTLPMTPLMLNAETGKLIVWDGEKAGDAAGILAISADQNSKQLTFYKSGSFRIEDVLWPESLQDDTKKRNAFAGTPISIV
jgi:hypothetical protein